MRIGLLVLTVTSIGCSAMVRQDDAVVQNNATHRLEELSSRLDAIEESMQEQRLHSISVEEREHSLAAQHAKLLALEKKIVELEKQFGSVVDQLSSKLGQIKKAVAGHSQFYIVKAGDNLQKIARAHGLSVAQLKERNKLTNDVIRVGQKLIVGA